MMFWIIFFAVLAVLAAGYFFSILPATSRRQECLKFAEWNYAHRGLWNAAEGVPENSLPAFARAAEQGYAIELDIQITKDGRIVVFHDDTMKRMCGNEGKISDYTYEELQQFHLGDSTEKIPLLREVLQTVDGRVPLLVEIKIRDFPRRSVRDFRRRWRGTPVCSAWNPSTAWPSAGAAATCRRRCAASFPAVFQRMIRCI